MNVTHQREIFKTYEQSRTLVQSVSELEVWFFYKPILISHTLNDFPLVAVFSVFQLCLNLL